MLNTTFLILIIQVILLLTLAGFFSCTETAITAITQTEERSLNKHSKKDKLTIYLISIKDNIVSATLVGTNLVNNLITSLATAFIISTFHNNTTAKIIGTIIITALIIFFAEILPKTFATVNALRITKFSAPLLNFFKIIFYPITGILGIISNGVLKFFSIFHKTQTNKLTKEQLKTLIEISTEDGAVNENERHLLTGVVRLRELKLKSILTPRTNIKGITETDNINKVITTFRKHKYSRLPVFSIENKNNITGIIHYKDLIFKTATGLTSIKEITRKCIYVPETAKIFSIIKTMKKERVNMVVAIDEHGETAGLVTMDDITSAVFGSVQDEYIASKETTSQIEILTPNLIRINGDTELYKINETLNINLKSSYYTTIAGLILEHAEVLPKEGEIIKIDGIKFKIEKIANRKILSIIADITYIHS